MVTTHRGALASTTPAPDANGASRSHWPRGRTMVIALLTTLTVAVVLFVVQTGDAGQSSSSDGVGGRFVPARYTVRRGDTISYVAQIHAVSEVALQEENDLSPSDFIDPGRQLTIPALPTEGRLPPLELTSDPNRPALEPLFDQWAAEYDIPAPFLKAVGWQRSGWTNAVVGEEGEVGIGQLAPDDVFFVNQTVLSGADLNPAVLTDNIQLTAAYLAHLLTETDGDYAATIVALDRGSRNGRTGVWDLDTNAEIAEIINLTAQFSRPLAGPTPSGSDPAPVPTSAA